MKQQQDNRLVSRVAVKAKKFVIQKQPSQLIPFKGTFPIIPLYQIDSYVQETREKAYIHEMTPEFQKAAIQGYEMAVLEDGFTEYLLRSGITVPDFLRLKNSEKATYLMRWLDTDKIPYEKLNIK